MDWKDRIEKSVKQFFPLGIVVAVLMAVLGVVMLFNPAGSLRGLVWLIVIGFTAGGIFRIVSYVKMPYWMRQGYTLVIGILDVLCGVMLIISAVTQPVITDEVFVWMVGFMFGFYALFAGIVTISGTGVAKRMGESTGWLVFAGVLEIIAGITLLMVPAVGTYFLMYALAFAFIVGGVNLFATTMDFKKRANAIGDYMDQNGDAFDPDKDPFSIWKNE